MNISNSNICMKIKECKWRFPRTSKQETFRWDLFSTSPHLVISREWESHPIKIPDVLMKSKYTTASPRCIAFCKVIIADIICHSASIFWRNVWKWTTDPSKMILKRLIQKNKKENCSIGTLACVTSEAKNEVLMVFPRLF